MSVNPLVPHHGNTQGQIQNTQSQTGDEAFNQFTRSDGNSKDLMDKAVSERTRLTRTKRVGNKNKAGSHSLFEVIENSQLEEEPVYRTVMVDGILFTLRLLAVA